MEIRKLTSAYQFSPRLRPGVFGLLFVSALLLAPAAHAFQYTSASPGQVSSFLPPVLKNVGFDQKLNHQIPLDLPFTDENGNSVRLGRYFGKKPVILSLVYFGCPMLCTTSEHDLLQMLKALRFTVGDQFDVLTVSFDPADKPAEALSKKRIYAGLYDRKQGWNGWHFLTGNQASIAALTQAVGFRYNYIPETKQFAHATGIIVLTPQGKVSRYFYGIQYPAGDVRLALIEADSGKIGTPVDSLILYCCEYSAVTGKYGVIISRVIKIAAGFTVVSLGALIYAMSRGGQRTAAA
jgi:protein SCO1/2